jgi:hypothetical protein
MDDIVGGQTEVKRLANLRLKDIGIPAARIRHARVDERRASPENEWSANGEKDPCQCQNACEELRTFHNNNQSITSVTLKQ